MLLLLLHAVEVPSYLAVAAGFWPLRAPVAAIRGSISSLGLVWHDYFSKALEVWLLQNNSSFSFFSLEQFLYKY